MSENDHSPTKLKEAILLHIQFHLELQTTSFDISITMLIFLPCQLNTVVANKNRGMLPALCNMYNLKAGPCCCMHVQDQPCQNYIRFLRRKNRALLLAPSGSDILLAFQGQFKRKWSRRTVLPGLWNQKTDWPSIDCALCARTLELECWNPA